MSEDGDRAIGAKVGSFMDKFMTNLYDIRRALGIEKLEKLMEVDNERIADNKLNYLNLNKELSELKSKINDVEAMTKHSHPVFKLKGNQNFDEIRELYKELAELKEAVFSDIPTAYEELKEQVDSLFHSVRWQKINTIEEVLRELIVNMRDHASDDIEFRLFFSRLLDKLGGDTASSASHTVRHRDCINCGNNIVGYPKKGCKTCKKFSNWKPKETESQPPSYDIEFRLFFSRLLDKLGGDTASSASHTDKICDKCGRKMDISMTSKHKGFWMCGCGNQQFEDFNNPTDAEKREAAEQYPLKFGDIDKKLMKEVNNIGQFPDRYKDTESQPPICDFDGNGKCHNKTIAHKMCFGYKNCADYQHIIADSLNEKDREYDVADGYQDAQNEGWKEKEVADDIKTIPDKYWDLFLDLYSDDNFILVEKADLKNMIRLLRLKLEIIFADNMESKYLPEVK